MLTAHDMSRLKAREATAAERAEQVRQEELAVLAREEALEAKRQETRRRVKERLKKEKEQRDMEAKEEEARKASQAQVPQAITP